jgi:hypothetical protein
MWLVKSLMALARNHAWHCIIERIIGWILERVFLTLGVGGTSLESCSVTNSDVSGVELWCGTTVPIY